MSRAGAALPIGLYLDIAVGVDSGGADAWMDQGAMLRGLSVGAPPDQFNPAGQNWGLTAYNPHGLVRSGFEPFRQMLRAGMRHAGAMRIDHVLGLMRLFVIPHGLRGRAGRLSPLAVRGHAGGRRGGEPAHGAASSIGEDLGTVPEDFRATLAAWGVWSYLVMMFERNCGRLVSPARGYPERAIATFNTHDLPTFAGWMSGHDLETKRAIGVDPGETDDERHGSRAALAPALARDRRQEHGFERCVAFLAATPTRLVSIAIEDVLGVRTRSTCRARSTEHPNWRRRWPVAARGACWPISACAASRRRCRAPAAARSPSKA